jgi:hypothetical protein
MLEDLLEAKLQRLTHLTKTFTKVKLSARSDFDYHSRSRKTFFNQVLKKLCARSKGGDSYLLRYIRTMQLDMPRLLARSLCSSLLFNLYQPS